MEVLRFVDTENQEHHTLPEVQELIEQLTDADILRLYGAFRAKGCRSRAGMTEHDVFQEVAIKALEMERAWPVGLSPMKFFSVTGLSIISNEGKKHSKLSSLPDPDDISPSENGTSILGFGEFQPSDHSNGFEDPDSVDAVISHILGIFDGDAEADCYLRQKLEEAKKSLILKICKLSEDGYKNVVNRIKYKMRKAYPNGIPWEAAWK